MIVDKRCFEKIVRCAPAWLLICGLALPACAQNQSPEDRYIADRDAAIARFTPDKVKDIDDKVSADEDKARAALETDMRAIITSAPAGFDKGHLNLSTLFTGDEDFGTLDGLLFEGDGGKALMILTTRSLLQRWLVDHKAWLPKEPMPSDPLAAFSTEDFYTQAVDSDSAVVRLAPIAIDASDSVAMLASRTQDAMPKAADGVFVAAVKGDRAYVAYRTLASPVSVPACTKVRAAVKGSSDAADKAFKSCFAASAPKAAHFADAVSAAKNLYDAMK